MVRLGALMKGTVDIPDITMVRLGVLMYVMYVSICIRINTKVIYNEYISNSETVTV